MDVGTKLRRFLLLLFCFDEAEPHYVALEFNM